MRLTTTLFTATLFSALASGAGVAAAADGRFYMMTADVEVSGTRDVEARDATRAIDRSLRVVEASRSADERAAALTNLCIGHTLRHEYDTALGYCDQAVDAAPTDAGAWVNRGVARYLAGARAASVKDFGKALALDPRVYQARANLAVARPRATQQLAETVR